MKILSFGWRRSFLKVAVVLFALFLGLNIADVYADSSISVTIDSNSLVLGVLPTSASGTFASSEDLNIGVSLTGSGGYTLGIRANAAGSSGTRLINSTDNTKYLASITSFVSPSTYADDTYASTRNLNNTWAYLPSKYNSSVNIDYRPAPNENGDLIDVTSGTDDSGSYTISIGSRIGLDATPGSYSNTFIITAVANYSCNPIATNITEALCMQDINDSVISSMTTHTQYRLSDNRDWKKYFITKTEDGRVWMTQNLDLDLETVPTNVSALTSKNTNLTKFGSDNYTTANGYSCSNEDTTIITTTTDCTAEGEFITWTPNSATFTAGNWGSPTNTAPRSFNYGDRYSWVPTSGGNATTYTSLSACEVAHPGGYCPHYHVGNYYNWTAAVASNSTSNITAARKVMGNSICPKGWRLPWGYTNTSNTNVGYYGEINYTWRMEGVVSGYVAGTGTVSTFSWNGIRTAPLYTVAAGAKTNTSAPGNVGSQARFWTSTINNSTTAYQPYATSGGAYPRATNTRSNGLSVRCVAVPSDNSGKTVITYDKNADDATGTMNTQDINANTFAYPSNNEYARDGYTFVKWNTRSDGTGISYNAGSQIYYAPMGSSITNTTLYAQWALNRTITFDKNASDATGAMADQTILGNSSVALSANQFSRSGYAFAGWSTSADGSVEYTDGQTYTVDADNTISSTTLYAKWDKVYEITFNLTGNATSVVFDNVVYTNGESTLAVEGRGYHIGGDYATKYGFSSWSATAGTFANQFPTTTYTVPSEDATITLTGQEATINMTTLPVSSDLVPLNCGLYGFNSWNPILAYDPRDNEAYWVGRLCDGNYWMLDNLRLDLTNSNVISVLSSSNTNASDDALNYLKNGGGSNANQYPITGLSGTNWTSSNSYSAPLVKTSGTTTNGSNNNLWTGSFDKDTIVPTIAGRGSGKVGVQYNYCAASAGTYCWGSGTGTSGSPSSDPNSTTVPTARDIEGDICPKGWRMPTGGAYGATTGAGEYQNLYNMYSSATQQASAFRNNLSLVPAGVTNTSGTMTWYNNSFNVWTSTWNATDKMNYITGNFSSNPNLNTSVARNYGLSVRCMRYEPVSITVNFASGVEKVEFRDSNQYLVGSITTSGSTISLSKDKVYYVIIVSSSKYAVTGWSATAGSPSSSDRGVANYIPSGNATITITSQEATTDMTTLVASADPVPNTCVDDPVNPILVYDPRDNEAYWVARLCDGNYWMLDNLRLNLTDSTVVNNLSTSNTNIDDASLTSLKSGNRTNGTMYANGGLSLSNWSSGGSFSVPQANISGSVQRFHNSDNTWDGYYTKDSVAPVVYGLGSGKIGVRYNYCAASAGSYCYGSGSSYTGGPTTDPNTTIMPTARDISSDICPKGWRMPTGGVYDTATGGGEYQRLYNTYSSAIVGQNAAFRDALSVVFSGYRIPTSTNNESGNGYTGSIWSSTWHSAEYMKRISFGGTNIDGVYFGTLQRNFGTSVRCILDQ